MPLANTRDKRTQIAWGLKDFRYRFQREPEGMWLPETAVDMETLDLLAEYGLRFVVLAPRQARAVRKIGAGEWQEVDAETIDTRRPYLCRLPSGRTISVFFYDGDLAKAVAFEGVLKDGTLFAQRLRGAFADDGDYDQLVHIATDGESYGHHHRFGEMALAVCLRDIQQREDVELTLYGDYLDRAAPADEAMIHEGSSWSCVHGVERWRGDCGCHSGGHPGWDQSWRGPLRDSLDWLRDELAERYENMMAGLIRDPWKARDAYIDVILDRSQRSRLRFLRQNARGSLNADERSRIWHLLEMQRNALLMYTSCGWFFDEISGIETVQILSYAAKAIQLAQEVGGADLRGRFLKKLRAAPSNIASYGNGAVVFKKQVDPSVVNMVRVAAHYVITSIFEHLADEEDIYTFRVKRVMYDHYEQDGETLAVGRLLITSRITEEQRELAFVTLHFGAQEVFAGISENLNEQDFRKIRRDLSRSFRGVRRRSALRGMRASFEHGPFTLEHLFRDEQTRILYRLLHKAFADMEHSFRQIAEDHSPVMRVVRQLNVPLPKILDTTLLTMTNMDLLDALGRDPLDFKYLERLVREADEWQLDIDRETIAYVAGKRFKSMMDIFRRRPRDQRLLRDMTSLLKTVGPLDLALDLGKPQNIYFFIQKEYYDGMSRQADEGKPRARRWITLFELLGQQLAMEIGQSDA